MLKQQRLFLVAAIEYLSDRNANFVAVMTNVRLKRFAPATVEQRSDSGHARCWMNRHGPLFDHLVSAGEHQLSRLHETKHSR